MQRDTETILGHHREKSVDNRENKRILNREAPLLLARSPRRSVSNFRDRVGGGSVNMVVIWEKPVLLTKREVLSLVIGLIATQDAELLATDNALSSQVCHERDRHCIRELGLLVTTIVSSWTYESSPNSLQRRMGNLRHTATISQNRFRMVRIVGIYSNACLVR